MSLYQLSLSIIFFLYGSCIGSFLLVCTDRIPLNRSILTGPSECPHCHHRLSPGDLIPILSWISLGGRCRYCRASVSYIYPLMEALTGALYVICYLSCGLTAKTIILCLFGSLLLIAAVIDIRHTYIPDRVSLGIVFLAIALKVIGQGPSLTDCLLGSITISGFMLLVSLITGGGIGLGDIKLFAASGLLLGLAGNVVAFFLGYTLAAFVCLPLLVSGKLTRGTAVPMAPFFAASLMISALWGRQLIAAYLSLFF